MLDECFYVGCSEAPTVEAIGTYSGVFGVEETVALAACVRHISFLGDEVVMLATQ